MATLRYGRKDEMESDGLGVRFMSEAKYDPRSLIEVMDILAASGGGSQRPEFLSTHPDPGNRAQNIKAAISERFPGGIPTDLTTGQSLQGR
jgi:predicted Zn-dependent protease